MLSGTGPALRSGAAFRREREFGFAVGGVLLALGAWWLMRDRLEAIRPWSIGAGALLVVVAAVAPRALVLPSRAWFALAAAISYVTTRLLLVVIYYGVLTPIGIARRLAGADPLRRRAGAAPSYWLEYPARQGDPRHYEKMF